MSTFFLNRKTKTGFPSVAEALSNIELLEERGNVIVCNPTDLNGESLKPNAFYALRKEGLEKIVVNAENNDVKSERNPAQKILYILDDPVDIMVLRFYNNYNTGIISGVLYDPKRVSKRDSKSLQRK